MNKSKRIKKEGGTRFQNKEESMDLASVQSILSKEEAIRQVRNVVGSIDLTDGQSRGQNQIKREGTGSSDPNNPNAEAFEAFRRQRQQKTQAGWDRVKKWYENKTHPEALHQPQKFDPMGNALDEEGNKIAFKLPEKTFKINQRQGGREEFNKKYRSIINERPESQQEALEKVAQIKKEEANVEDPSESLKATVLRSTDDIQETSVFFDPRFKEKKTKFSRQKRSFFEFNEPGKFVKQGSTMRQEARLKVLQNQIENMARRTGIQQSSRLATVAHSAVKDNMALPLDELNWWDLAILESEQADIELDCEKYQFKDISNLVEHPIEIAPPMKSTASVQIPVFYTKTERKKRRRLRRRDELKEQQEKIRLGLIPAPEPKVKLANMMQVLGNEAVVDPTKVEARVREQMANRQKKHFADNNARKLTKDEKRAKKEKRMKEDLTHSVEVSIYLIKNLRHAATRWKIKENCAQLYMTGVCLTTPDHSILIIEGGPKSQRKYRRLMLHRIKWKELEGEEAPNTNEAPKIEEDDGRVSVLSSSGDELCKLVWEGKAKSQIFKGDMQVIKMHSDINAKDFFEKHQIIDYWRLIQSKLLICNTD